jgi:Ca2+-transporting ATPase
MTQVAAAPAAGLSSAEAAGRLARYGPNELPRARATPWWRLVADQVRDPLIVVLLAAAVLTVATGDLADASIIMLVIVVNTTAGVVQEVKAGQAIAAYLLPGRCSCTTASTAGGSFQAVLPHLEGPAATLLAQ